MHPGESIGAYVLVRLLGEGGMKQVWRARDPENGRDVALAIVHQFDPRAFRNEVALAIRVKSPHVARMFDGFVTEHGVAVVVSELCDGLDLMHYRQAREVTPGEAVAMVAQMATGLAAIHSVAVLHRDVKPSNAILTASGVKMIDFGVSLPAMDATTATGSWTPPAGTLAYMAPEAVSGDVDARLDTYALGVSLFELVVGRLPLPHAGFHEWMNRLVRAEPLPADVLDVIDLRVAAMFERLTCVDRERRPYVTDVEAELHALAREMGGAVPAAIGLPPVSTLPPPPPRPPRAPQTKLVLAAPPNGPVAPTMYVDALPVPAVGARGFRLNVSLPEPERVVVGWPHVPVLALWPDVHSTVVRTVVRGFDCDGKEKLSVPVMDDLRGGLVADLDGDGVGELYAWSESRLHVVDAAGCVRACLELPRRRGSEPWDGGSPAPIVLEGALGRELAVGSVTIDGVTREVQPLAGGWQGQGAALVDALGFTGLSCHGAARQRFRGDVGTPAAILARRRVPGFVVASLERVFDGHPTVMLGLWGPGGTRVGGGEVGSYDFRTAPWEMMEEAQRPSHAHFASHVAPLALLGNGAPADDVIVVPYLHNAPWFGPVLVAFDGTGQERWRARVPALLGSVSAPPMLVDLDGSGAPQLVWAAATAAGHGAGVVHRRDARTGA
ncbi:MAG TPA: serine/threonine-protein kinase, partial [Kofleriaceae bacterium]|nr:serine/threonine-protein kinase [Kofleriaceae bacterium]